MANKTESIPFTLYCGEVQGKFFPDSHIYTIDGKRPPSVTGIIGIMDKSRALVPWALEEATKSLLPRLGKKLTEAELVKAVFSSQEKKDKAADIGTAIHEWCENYILSEMGRGDVPEMPKDKAVQIGAEAFMAWHDEHKVKFLSSERVVYSRKHNYIGTLDIEAKVDGKLCLIDLKSSNGLYNSVRMQTAAYVKADEEESGKSYDGRWAIRLAKETEEEYLERMEVKNQIKQFLGKKPSVVKPYQVFEAKFLDEEIGDLERDFQAFLACQKLTKWNNETDFYEPANKN